MSRLKWFSCHWQIGEHKTQVLTFSLKAPGPHLLCQSFVPCIHFAVPLGPHQAKALLVFGVNAPNEVCSRVEIEFFSTMLSLPWKCRKAVNSKRRPVSGIPAILSNDTSNEPCLTSTTFIHLCFCSFIVHHPIENTKANFTTTLPGFGRHAFVELLQRLVRFMRWERSVYVVKPREKTMEFFFVNRCAWCKHLCSGCSPYLYAQIKLLLEKQITVNNTMTRSSRDLEVIGTQIVNHRIARLDPLLVLAWPGSRTAPVQDSLSQTAGPLKLRSNAVGNRKLCRMLM